MMADEVEDDGGWRDAVVSWWQRGYNGTDNNYNKQQSTNERRQRRMTRRAGKKWDAVVEVVEERLFGGWRRLKWHGGRLVAEGLQQRWQQLEKTTTNKWAAAKADEDDSWQVGARWWRWWTPADEVENNGGWRDAVDGGWQRSHNGADNNYKKPQSTNERRQRRRAMMAGERWGVVVEVEEQLLYGSRGFMVKS
jgi:hypothetical protein